MNGAAPRTIGRDARDVPDRRMHPSDALAIIQYLDELSERLWADYGDDIVAEFGADVEERDDEFGERQIDLALEDEQPF